MLDLDRPTLDETATTIYAHLFQALSDPTRLAVIQHLTYGEHRVRDLVDHLGLAQSTVSKHLSFLAECRLVSVRPAGRASWYSLSQPVDLAKLIVSAERLLQSTGTQARLCPHLHEENQPETGAPS